MFVALAFLFFELTYIFMTVFRHPRPLYRLARRIRQRHDTTLTTARYYNTIRLALSPISIHTIDKHIIIVSLLDVTLIFSRTVDQIV